MPRVKTVLFVSDVGDRMGGAERSLLATVGALDRARFTACVVLGCGGELEARLTALGVPVTIVPMPAVVRTRHPLRLLGLATSLLRTSLRIRRFASRQKVDLLYANKNTTAFHTAVPALLLSKPCLWHVRNRASRFGRVGAWLVRRYTKVLFVSDAIRRPFDAAFPALQSRFETLHEGIALCPGDAREADAIRRRVRSELDVPADAPVVGMVGRVTPWKGQAEFLEAAASILRQEPGVCFLMVGDCVSSPEEASADRRYRDQLRTRAEALGLAAHVRFTGYRDDVPALLAAMDVFVLPSWEEPYGLALVEAMAAGVPAVATRAGGVPEIAEHGEHALLVPPKRPDVIVSAVLSLLRDCPAADAMARRARQHVEHSLTHDAYMIRLQSVLESSRAKRPRARSDADGGDRSGRVEAPRSN